MKDRKQPGEGSLDEEALRERMPTEGLGRSPADQQDGVERSQPKEPDGPADGERSFQGVEVPTQAREAASR